ncbi:hypothetical protein CRP7_gp35 [Roseobacter phage CRP-7]|nr:hypothetical protein CRP7_gp35 [Roseobacter phage CRP-7]
MEFMNSPTFTFLKGLEGYEDTPYILNESTNLSPTEHKSGLTVGAGIDFGQHSYQGLVDLGLPLSMIDKAEKAGWIGLNPDTIKDPITGLTSSETAAKLYNQKNGKGSWEKLKTKDKMALSRPIGHKLMSDRFNSAKDLGNNDSHNGISIPQFTKEELAIATPIMYKTYEEPTKEQYNKKFGNGSWDSLNEEMKAILTTERYHTGKKVPDAMLIAASQNNRNAAALGSTKGWRGEHIPAHAQKAFGTPGVAVETSLRPQSRPLSVDSDSTPQAVNASLTPKARPADLQDPRNLSSAEGYGSVGGPNFSVPPPIGPFREGNPTLYPVPAPEPITVGPIANTPIPMPQKDPRFEGVPVPRGVPDSPRLSDTFVGAPSVQTNVAQPFAVEPAGVAGPTPVSMMQQVPQPAQSFNEAFAAGRAAAGGDGGTFMYNDKLYNTNLAKYNQGTQKVMPRYYEDGTGFVDFFKNLFGSNPNPVPGDMRGSPQGISGLSAEQLAAANSEARADASALNPNIIPVPAFSQTGNTEPGALDTIPRVINAPSAEMAARNKQNYKEMTSVPAIPGYNVAVPSVEDPRNLGGSEGYGQTGFVPLTEQDMLRQDNLQYLNEQLDDLNKRIVFMPSGSEGRAILQTQIDRIKGEIIGYGGTPEFNIPEAKQTGVNTGLITAENDLREANTELRTAKTSDEIAAAAAKAAAARDAIDNSQTIPDLDQSIVTAEDIKSVTEGKDTIAEIDNQINNTVDPSLINALNRKKERVQADIDAAQTNLNNEKLGAGKDIEEVPPPVVTEEPPVVTAEDPADVNREKVLNDMNQVTGPDGKVVKMPGEKEANSFGTTMSELGGKLGPIFKSLFGLETQDMTSLFGLETQDMTRALGFYLVSRLSGASHEGSMRWAGTTVLKQAEARNIRDSSRADAAAKAFTAISGNYTKEAASKIRSALAKGNIVEAQALMDDANNKTVRGKLGIDPNATGTFYMMPGYTKAVEVFEGTGGNRYTKVTTTEDGKTVEKYVPISSQQMGSLRERNQDDDITSYLAAVRSHVNTMNPELFKEEYTDDKGNIVRPDGIFSGRSKAGVTEDIMKISRQQGEKGLPDDPREIMLMVSKAAELAESMGVKKINAETLFEMQLIGGDILFDQDKISKDGELVPASNIKSFTTDFQDILGNDRGLIGTTMNTAAKSFNPEMTIDSIKATDNYNKLSKEEKLKIDSAPSSFMALALLTAYENKPNK